MTISNLNYRKIFLTFIFAAMFLSSLVFAQTTAQTEESLPGVSQEKVAAALADLSNLLHFEVATVAKARLLCNEEQYLQPCIDVGRKYSLYSAEEAKTVDVVVQELKGRVSEDIKNCDNEDCLVRVANDLAKKLVAKNPDLAAKLDLTPKKVEEKKIILAVAKEAGVNFSDCQSMDPETASIELLRSCAKLAKDSRIQQYIPEDRRADSGRAEKTVELRTALASKELACGDGTLDGCGNFCLNPSPDLKREGISAIPQVCRQIAEKFFGVDGIRQLESSYKQVGEVSDQYVKKIENAAFTTIDGKVLSNPAEIGSYLEQEGKKGNVEAVTKGMDFMIQRGFIKQQDKEYALKFVQKVHDTGNQVDFSACEKDPRSCQKFIPDAHKQEFEVLDQVQQVLGRELGFDSRECRRGEFDHDIAMKCFEASKRALPQLEALAVKSGAAAQIVSDLRGRIVRGEEAVQNNAKFERNIGNENGPGGCTSAETCRSYCFDPAHGPECIAFGARAGIFKANEIAQRLDEYNAYLAVPQSVAPLTDASVRLQAEESRNQQRDFRNQFPGTGPFEGFLRPGQGGIAPGQFTGFREPGRGFGSSVTPECLAAIQEGDFVRAKGVCEISKEVTAYRDVVRPVTQPTCSAVPDPNACSNQPDTFPSRGQNCETVCVRKYVQPQPYPIEPPPGDQNFPHIDKISPYSGPIGSRVTIYGMGFEDSNRINFDVGIIPGVASQDGGHSIGFTIPDDRAPACAFTNPRCLLPAPYNPVKPGNYEISVTTSRGTSNRFVFVVTDSSAILGDACKELESVLPGCHSMPESPKARFDSTMTKYEILDGSRVVQYCSESKIPGCYNWTTVSEVCPAGYYKYYPPEGGAGYCKPVNQDNTPCPAGTYRYYSQDGSTSYCRSNTESKQCDWSTQYLKTSTNSCLPKSNCTDTTNAEYNSSECSGVRNYNNASGTTGTAACSSEAIKLLGSGCHVMYSAWFNTEMTKWINPGTVAVNDCTINYAYGCTVGNNNQASTTTSTDCPTKYGTGWHVMPGAGTETCFNPDMTGYRSSAGTLYSCSTNYIAGCSSSVTSTSTTSVDCPTKYGTGWHSMSEAPGKCFDPDMKNYRDSGAVLYSCSTNYIAGCSTTVQSTTITSNDCSAKFGSGWHIMDSGTSGRCFDGDMKNYKDYSNGTSYSCSTNYIYGCTTTTTTTSTTSTTCPSGQYWNGTSCVNSTTASGTTTTSTDCPTKYGTGWHTMDSSGRCFNPDMSSYKNTDGTLYSCSTSYVSGCSSGGSTTSTTCPSGQVWNGTSCSTWSSDPATACAQAGSGYFWNGTSCVSSGSTACPTGQYWNGTSCVNNTTTTCATGQYWNGTSCVSTCPTGQYWNGTACVNQAYNTLGSRLFANIQYSLEALGEWFVGMFR